MSEISPRVYTQDEVSGNDENRSTDIWENVAAARIPCRKLRTVCTHGMDFLASVASEGGALSKIAPRVYT